MGRVCTVFFAGEVQSVTVVFCKGIRSVPALSNSFGLSTDCSRILTVRGYEALSAWVQQGYQLLPISGPPCPSRVRPGRGGRRSSADVFAEEEPLSQTRHGITWRTTKLPEIAIVKDAAQLNQNVAHTVPSGARSLRSLCARPSPNAQPTPAIHKLLCTRSSYRQSLGMLISGPP
jgi:hypothetical protein